MGTALALRPGVEARVLIVDDEPTVLAALTRHLRARGLSVVCASDARGAIEALDSQPFAVVVSDLHLSPGTVYDGLEVLEHAQGLRPSPCTVALSAHTSPALEREALKRGARAFLVKHAALAALAAEIHALTDEAHPEAVAQALADR